MKTVFAELHCLSNFSFLRGASHAQELVVRAKALGYAALALTDECSLAGVVRAHEAAKEHGLHLIIGTEIQLVDGPKLVLLATDRESYGNLCALITRGRRNADKGTYRLTRADLDDGVPGCLALLIGETVDECAGTPAASIPAAPDEEQSGSGSTHPSPSGSRAGDEGSAALPREGAGDAETVSAAPFVPETSRRNADWLHRRFADRAWIAVELHHGPHDADHLLRMQALARSSGLPLVASNDVHMHARGRRALQDVLTAARIGTSVAQAGRALFPNAERHLRPIAKLARLYPARWLAASVAIARRCTFSLDELRYEYPEEVVASGQTPTSWLRKLVEDGLRWRYRSDPAPASVRTLIEHELALIAELRYEAYFLTVYDIVHFARSQGILCQGRGSAANSAVCYALGITEVDPARGTLLFERFISKERNEPPDIDVDFEHQRREEVIQYIYAKYGRHRAALAATVISYRAKSAFRDVGKALGLDLAQVNRIAQNLAFWDRGGEVPERLRESGFDPESRMMRRLLALTQQLIGFPRHLSQHVGGFVISRGPLDRMVPIENAAMDARTVIQWDKDDLDTLGLLKVDVLALGMLSAIRRALAMAGAWRGSPITMQDIPAEDPAVYAMLQRADSVGVFQIESRAQMSMLPRLKPQCFYDLVIEVAIVRPGPIQGGMVHPYLRRRQGVEAVTYPSEKVRSVLERTLGIPIFQEQVMQLAVVAAGFTPGEADGLRRSMAAWRRKGGLEHYERKLIDGMCERGYTEQFAQQIYQQIRGFGEYGFPESHSASFALLVYDSAWLKHHHPAAFCAGLLNSQPMGFYSPSQLVQDAQRHGVEVLPVDVLVSQWDCELELASSAPALPGVDAAKSASSAPTPVPPPWQATVATDEATTSLPAVRLGLRMIAGFPQAAAERLITARREPFADFEQLALRAQLNRHDLECLARADALARVTGHRREALWQVAGIEARPPVLRDAPIHEQQPLLPEPTEGETIVADYSSLGLTLGRHPLALLRPHLDRLRMFTATRLLTARHGQLVRAAGLVTCRQRPGTASGVIFVTLEDETGSTNVVVWRDLGERQRRPLLGARLLGVHGVLERDRTGDVTHLIAGKLVDLSHLLGRLTTHSRDFH
ncbi:MAG: error-prone DNA polymerase [Betaproteobacteria bacterium]